MFNFLPGAEVVHVGQAFLQQVVAQVRFNSQGVLSTHSGVSRVHDALADRYPRLTPEQQMIVTAAPGSNITTTTVPQFRFQELRGAWAVVLGPDHATIETLVYNDWSELRFRMNEVLAAVGEAAPLRVRERVGLRYINHVQPDPEGSFASRVRDNVLGVAGDQGWRSQLVGSLSQVIVADEGAQLTLRHGLAPAPETPVSSTPYLVDIDCADSEPAEYDITQVMSRLDELNDAAYRCFSWCVEEEYRSKLEKDQAS